MREESASDWIIAGKFSYWTYGSALPISVIKKVNKLTYQFIWNGGLGVSDFFTLAMSPSFKRQLNFGFQNNAVLKTGLGIRRRL